MSQCPGEVLYKPHPTLLGQFAAIAGASALYPCERVKGKFNLPVLQWHLVRHFVRHFASPTPTQVLPRPHHGAQP